MHNILNSQYQQIQQLHTRVPIFFFLNIVEKNS